METGPQRVVRYQCTIIIDAPCSNGRLEKDVERAVRKIKGRILRFAENSPAILALAEQYGIEVERGWDPDEDE